MADLFVGLENGQKKLIPTSSEARSGNPLGTILAIHSNVVPYGYLPCNGVAFDENQYPALYALLGDNHTPDLRECNLVGAGQSERTILDDAGHAHDVYTIGQFKDDQIQDFRLSYNDNYTYASAGNNSAYSKYDTSASLKQNISFTSDDIRSGTTTHGKNFGVNYVIKATSGLEETQQDYVLQSLLEADSYSLEEVATGKKWIDGKMIYRKVLNYSVVNLPSQGWTSVAQDTMNIEVIIDICNFGTDGISGRSVAGRINNGYIQMFAPYGWSSVGMIIEYTKAD